MIEISNADRAAAALSALHHFVESTNVDTARDAIADLIGNLLHLAHGRGLNTINLIESATRMMDAERLEDPAGDMAAVQRGFRALLAVDD